MDSSLLISVSVGVPFLAALAILAVGRLGDRKVHLISHAAALVTAAAVFSLAVRVMSAPGFGSAAPGEVGSVPTLILGNIMPGVPFALKVDALGLTFAMLASLLWVLASFYSVLYMRLNHYTSQPRFFAAFSAAVGAAIGVALSANLVTFLVFFETLTLTTYPLVVHKESREAMGAGRRYLLFALSGGLALTVGTAWLWIMEGQIDFRAGGFVSSTDTWILSLLFALLVGGCAVKAAIMPLHAWLPEAMVAPSPVSGLLHAVAVVKAGVFGTMRMVGFVFGPETLRGLPAVDVAVAACLLTIVIASVVAFRQVRLKTVLAYSTISHLSCIVLGVLLLAPRGYTGAMMHMVNHGFAKFTLFLCAGAVYAVTHFDRVDQLQGLGRRMPVTFVTFSVAAMALVGIPGLCGFVSKLLLGWGAVEAGSWLSAGVILGSSILSGAYLVPIIQTAFHTPLPEGSASFRDPGPMILVPLIVAALLTVVFGLVWPVFNAQYDLAQRAVTAVFGIGP